MFRGSPGLSAGQLANLIAAMGGQFDADTQQTVTQYFFTVPAEDLEIALNIAAVRMQGVLDSEDLWQKERGAIEQEVAQDFSNPMYVFYDRLLSGMFAGTPYAHTPLGTRPSFQKTTGAMLKAFYDKWYAPNNAVMVIVGDVDVKKTLVTVKKLFEDIPPKPLGQRPEVKLAALQPASIAMDTDFPYGLAVVAYRLPGYGDPDCAAGQILADVLGSQRGNLYALVPEGKALLFDFSTSLFPHAGLGYAVAGTNTATPATARMDPIPAAFYTIKSMPRSPKINVPHATWQQARRMPPGPKNRERNCAGNVTAMRWMPFSPKAGCTGR